MIYKFLKKEEKEVGFTLIESLISITILMISVAAPLSLAGQGIMGASIAQKQIIAFYLAQDATESLINIKIGNKLDLDYLIEGMAPCKVADFSENSGCTVDTLDLSDSCAESGNGCTDKSDILGISSHIVDSNCLSNSTCGARMYKKDSSGFYSHDSNAGLFSGFVRYSKIRVISISNPGSIDEEAEIETTVR
jgi:type II secretory pathway pseudopilin PulG